MDADFASIWEIVADTVPDRLAIVQGSRRITYRTYEEQAARLASALVAAGVEEGAGVGLYLYNSAEYLIGQFGGFKCGAVPVNVNYRYLDDELAYLLIDSGAQAIVFHTSLGDRVDRIRDKVPKLRLLVEVDDGGAHVEGAVAFDDLLAAHEPAPRAPSTGRERYMLYTGGTTGMPKGVMYRHGDFSGRLYDAYAMLGVAPPPQRASEIPAFVEAMVKAVPTTSVPCCPLMHGTGMWISAMRAHLVGGTVVLLESRHFDAHELWDVVERERVTEIVIVGDAFARPLLRALEEREAQGTAYDTSSVAWIVSSGTIWSAELKDGLRERTPAVLLDLLGSTEAGTIGSSVAGSDTGAETAKFSLASGARVVTEDDRRGVVPGSGERGMLATQSAAYGYWNDPEKSARTFVEIDGVTYVISGDWATVEADGSITLLGRGSNCINTGGEKVFPEEVEEAVKRHPGIDDCMVVGIPDERFGQRVAAVASSSATPPPSEEELRHWLRPYISHFKIPSTIVVLEAIRRAPNGKADYDWARRTVSAGVTDG